MKSHLGKIIYEITDSKEMSIYQLAAKVPHTNSSTFSKIRSGQYVRISDDRLTAIASALAPHERGLRTQIICEYLKDMCPKDFRHLIDISPKEKTSGKHDYRSSDINETLNLIGQAAASDQTFKAHLDSLRLLAESLLEQALDEERGRDA